MGLSDLQIKNAEFTNKQFKLYDEDGMYVLINASGKYFRLDYRFAGKRKTLALGVYPKISLKDARKKNMKAKELISNGTDPILYKNDLKAAIYDAYNNTFEKYAHLWFDENKSEWSEDHAQKKWSRLKLHALPSLKNLPISEITPPMILSVIRKIEKEKKYETAHRILGICSEIFSYAIGEGKLERDPTRDIQKLLKSKRTQHRASIHEAADVKKLLNIIDAYKGNELTVYGLKLLAYLFVRPSELRLAVWSEFDFKNKLWKIPAERMKMRREHIVPLSTQVINLFMKLYEINGNRQYVFYSSASKYNVMSNNTMLQALLNSGYSRGEISVHGFRHMASTILNEHKWPADHIEVQLSHEDENHIRGIYNSARYIDDRRVMMQWWADYLDTLRFES